jgi:branched-chain amino acid transport system substrate-binding protein
MIRTLRAFAVCALGLCLAAPASCSGGPDPVRVGAVYPVGGAQGPGGLEEFRGLQLAADLVNREGGVHGRPIRVELREADAAEAAPAAVRSLVSDGVGIIAGSYGSTVSVPAAEAATDLGAVFWETGAVGMLGKGAASSDLAFRFAPTGASLGLAAVAFVRDQLAPRMDRGPLRFSVAYVDDVYGRSVAAGAIGEIESSRQTLAGTFPYQPTGTDFDALVGRIERAHTDVLMVVAYLDDGAELRRAVLRAELPLAATIGTSSSYCHPQFGELLGPDAVGVFASDKPDADVVEPSALTPDAASLLVRARDEYVRRHGVPMSAAALSGFSGGWALFRHVLPDSQNLSPGEVAAAARRVRLPLGALPNGSGLRFGSPGTPGAGDNALAASVIWEWVRPYTRAIVWPPAFATSDIVVGTGG